MQVTIPVDTQLEVDHKHHTFLAGTHMDNIKQIMQMTGARYGCMKLKVTMCEILQGPKGKYSGGMLPQGVE